MSSPLTEPVTEPVTEAVPASVAAPAGAGQQARRLKVTQTRSKIGGTANQRETLRSLGLKRIGDVVVKPDRPEFRGMVRTVAHLVTVEEVD